MDIYRVAIFKQEGFKRKRCITCGRTFWTLDPERKTCGDTPCDEYGFIGNPPIGKPYSLPQMEKKFLKFFKNRGHEIIDRYPVVARWRDDIFLTIASIAPFQPWVTSGLVPPPANPLVVSQPSIRLKDIDSVGRSGRHFTLFFMGGHHAFSSKKQRIYWSDETLEFCHEFLTRELGIEPTEISYIQDFWEGGGNAGEDFEVNVRGLELVTLVFMHYASRDGKYSPIPLNIVDTGYGMERLVWASQGTASSYEVIFAPVVYKLRSLASIELPPADVLREHSKLAGLMDIETGRDLLTLRTKAADRTGLSIEELNRLMSPLEAVHAIADHLRCLAFMFGDGITPSNVKAGYLARLVLRRTLRLMHEIQLEKPLAELLELELKYLTQQFPEFRERQPYILEVAGLEERRYHDTLAKGGRLLERIISDLRSKGKEELPAEKILELYDSQGIPSSIVEGIAQKLGVKAEVPEDFYIRLAKLHARGVEGLPAPPDKVPKTKLRRLKATKPLYYEDPYVCEFRARVLRTIGDQVVLDRSAFYPEGGGQPADTGELTSAKGKARVVDVQKFGDVIVHRVEPNVFGPKQGVKGAIDWGKRSSLMRHHTGTHILLEAARRVLGAHVWQHGVQKGVDRTRLDITHFKRVEPDELGEIERLANEIVMENREVDIGWMDRNSAEQMYGFELYQGGIVPGKQIRAVNVQGWNVQACAGTHCLRTGEVGFIKITHTERIADGIERLEFSAGEAALKFVQRQEEEILKAARILRARPPEVSAATRQLFRQWKNFKKEVTRSREILAKIRLEDLRKKIKPGEILCEIIGEASVEELIKIASILVQENINSVVALGMRDKTAKIVIMAGVESVRAGTDCGKLAASAAGLLDGGGGGRPEMGQGSGPKVEGLGKALERVAELWKEQILR